MEYYGYVGTELSKLDQKRAELARREADLIRVQSKIQELKAEISALEQL